MKKPTEVTIGPRKFTIEYHAHLLNGDKTQRLNGHIMYDQATIKIDDGLSDQSTRLTIMHEIIHGVADAALVELDEKEVEILANVLTASLAASPEIVNMFLETTC